MAWTIIRNFSFSFRPIYYFSRIFGLIPFSIIHDINGDVLKSKVRKIDGVLFAAFIILHLIFSTYFCMSPLIVESPTIPNAWIFLEKLIRALIHFHNIMIGIINMYNRDRIINILKMFDTFDKEVTIFQSYFCF